MGVASALGKSEGVGSGLAKWLKKKKVDAGAALSDGAEKVGEYAAKNPKKAKAAAIAGGIATGSAIGTAARKGMGLDDDDDTITGRLKRVMKKLGME